VLRLKVLNLPLTPLPVHSAFLRGESECLNKRCASESESLKVELNDGTKWLLHCRAVSRFKFLIRQAHAYYSSRISSAMLVRDSRTSSANGAFGRQDRQDNAGMRLVTAASR